MGKAQVSLEFLVLMAAFLAFLAAWLPLIGKMKADSERALSISYARESAARLAGALDDVCMLGGGNVREVDVRLVGGARVEGKGNRVFIVGKEYAVGADRLCSTTDFQLVLDGPGRLRVGARESAVVVEAIN